MSGAPPTPCAHVAAGTAKAHGRGYCHACYNARYKDNHADLMAERGCRILPRPAIYYCDGPKCVTRREGRRQVGKPGAQCGVCDPNQVHARAEDLAAMRYGHIPDPAKARKHPYPVGSLAADRHVGVVDWAALGALAPEGE
jgi:hypothetical protein